jgi:hypothetical protein
VCSSDLDKNILMRNRVFISSPGLTTVYVVPYKTI